MTRRTRPAEEAGEYDDEPDFEATPEPGTRQRKAPDHTPAFLRFTPPQNSSEGEGRAYSMPHTPDRDHWKRFIRGATDTRGVFGVEIRNKNQSIIGRDSIEVEPEQSARQYAPAQQTMTATAAPIYAPPAPSGTTEAVTTARELVGLAKDLTPPKAEPEVTREDVARMLDEKFDRIADRLKPPPAQPSDPFELITKVLTLQDQMRRASERDRPEPPEQTSELDNALRLYDKLQELRERVEPAPEGRSLLSQAGSLLSSLSNAATTPFGQALLMRLLGGPQGAAQQVTSTPQPNGAARDAQSATLAVFNTAVQDLKRNKRVGRTADAIEELTAAHPDLAAELDGFLLLPPPEILAQLSQVAGEDLTTYAHAYAWVEVLQAELRPQDEEDDAPEMTASSNGHKAEAAPVQ